MKLEIAENLLDILDMENIKSEKLSLYVIRFVSQNFIISQNRQI